MAVTYTHIKSLGLLLFFILFLLQNLSQAQTGNETFRHITPRDGLSSGFVWDMLEDKNGYIWIATNVGLDKYDGYSVTTFRNDPSDPTTITGGSVFSILDDNHERFWIGTTNGLSIMHPQTETFKQVEISDQLEPLNNVRSIEQTENGDIWVGAENGIYRFSQQEFAADTIEASHFWITTTNDTVSTISSLSIQDNTLWVGTDSDLFKFNLETNEFELLPEFDDDFTDVITGTIWELLTDSKGTLWISSTSGLAKWEPGSNPEVIKSLGLYDEETFTGGSFQALTEDTENHLWISTGLIGAIRYNLESGEVKTFRHDPENSNSIQEDDVHYAFVDKAGNIWFGYHDLGMSLAYSQDWTYTYNQVSDEFDAEHPLNYIHSYLDDSEGNGWLATHWGLGFFPADGGPFRYFPIYPDKLSEDDNENDLEALSIVNDQIFVLTHSNEIHQFNKENESFKQIETPDDIGDIFMISSKIHVNLDHLYLGIVDNKLLRIELSTLESELIDVPQLDANQSILQQAIYPLIDLDGNIFLRHYFASASGLSWISYQFDPTTESFNRLDLPSPENITVFGPPVASATQPGIIWSIVDNGLLREDLFNNDSQLFFQDDAGVLNETNRFILEDEQGYIWISNLTGISRLDPVADGITYFEADPNRKPTQYHESSVANNGDIIFSGEGGYTRFNPDELVTESPIQNIYITELWTGNEVSNILHDERSGPYELGYDNNNISISYIGLNYRDPNYTRYRYRLNGYDDNWNNVGTQRRVFLANLPPGDYRFQVQAAQRFGGFSETSAELSLSILPPWWQTLPAYIAYFLIFIGGAFAIDRIQRRRLISKERERAREKELEQAKEIEKAYKNLKAAQEQLVQQEKLASLGQLTAGIAHEIKNPLNFVNNFADLSIELVEEAREEVKNQKSKVKNEKSPFEEPVPTPREGKSDVVAKRDDPGDGHSLILEILDDIETNLRKIHEHGSRADSIVKSMLQHSRGGNNKVEPTDINALIKEYTNLAFHGMRAGKKPINVDIELDLDDRIDEIPLIAEDFSRVILNLCNNAFDAMREKLSAVSSQQSAGSPFEEGHEQSVREGDSPEQYVPKLSIRTHKNDQAVTIEIEDNGPGIPDEIKDKILQPFFTTKKGKEGTGLGLSITHDIVKAHGGSIEIASKDEGTQMRIILTQK